jgi:hypothetical protein
MDYMDYGNLSTFGEEFTLNAEKAFGFWRGGVQTMSNE